MPARGQPPITRLRNKGARQEILPNRHALNTLTKGDPMQRSIGNYAKAAPTGAEAPVGEQTILDMAAALAPPTGTKAQ
jgi:hypothetical protein